MRCSGSRNGSRESGASAKNASCASNRSERRRRLRRVLAGAAASEVYAELVLLCVHRRVLLVGFLEAVVSTGLVVRTASGIAECFCQEYRPRQHAGGLFPPAGSRLRDGARAYPYEEARPGEVASPDALDPTPALTAFVRVRVQKAFHFDGVHMPTNAFARWSPIPRTPSIGACRVPSRHRRL